MTKFIINSKEVDISTIVVEDIYTWDHPDYCDAFIAEGRFTDGTLLSEKELGLLEDNYSEGVAELILEHANNYYIK